MIKIGVLHLVASFMLVDFEITVQAEIVTHIISMHFQILMLE